MSNLVPRPYQYEIVNRAREEFRRGARAVLMVMPTGSGKTASASLVVEGALKRNKRVLWLACRRELVKQAAERMPARAGILMAGCPVDPSAPIQVGSIDTIASRLERPLAELVVYDEAHHVCAATSQSILAHYPKAHLLGLTATPSRGDGTALGNVFDEMVSGPTIQDLIAWGFLVPVDILAPKTKSKALASDPVAAWEKYSDGRPGFVFCKTIDQSKELVEDFNKKGIPAAHVDANTNKTARDQAIDAFRRGRIDVLSSVNVFTEGVDVPRAAVCMLARGYTHTGSYLQAVGRVLRPHPGKARALVLDLIGNVINHGLPDDIREWSLEGRPISRGESLESCTQCELCGAVWRSGTSRVCAVCGWEMEGPEIPMVKPRPLLDARTIPRGPLRPNATREEKTKKLEALKAEAREKKYRYGWVEKRFAAIYGHTPMEIR